MRTAYKVPFLGDLQILPKYLPVTSSDCVGKELLNSRSNEITYIEIKWSKIFLYSTQTNDFSPDRVYPSCGSS